MTRSSIHPGYIFAGVATLVSVSFLDNVRGPLLPVLCDQLGISYSEGGLFLTVGNFAAVLSTLLMGQALKKFSEKRVTLFICAFCSIPGLVSPFVDTISTAPSFGDRYGCLRCTDGKHLQYSNDQGFTRPLAR